MQVHYHIIPAPALGTSPLTVTHMHQSDIESREELDDDDAAVLLRTIRAHL